MGEVQGGKAPCKEPALPSLRYPLCWHRHREGLGPPRAAGNLLSASALSCQPDSTWDLPRLFFILCDLLKTFHRSVRRILVAHTLIFIYSESQALSLPQRLPVCIQSNSKKLRLELQSPDPSRAPAMAAARCSFMQHPSGFFSKAKRLPG